MISLIKRIFSSTVFSINIIAIAILLLSAFSDRISPVKAAFFSFLGMGFPFILCVNVFFLIWWLIFRKWKRLLICAISLLLCWGSIHTYFPLHTRTKEVPETCIKVLTYNVMGFHHSNPHTEKEPNPVLQFIIDSDADIVCIQEHRTYTPSEGRHLLSPDDLRKALKKYPYSHFSRIETADPSLGIYGLSLYSKYPILSTKRISFSSKYNGAFLAELKINGKMVSLINCHLQTNNLSNEDRKQYYEFTKAFNSKKIDVVAESAVRKLKPAFQTRALQADKVAEIIRNETHPYVIVCGDFNDTPISYARKTILGDLEDAFAETGNGLGITYNRNRFYFRIDYIMHSKNMKAYNCSVGKLKDSDHYPVWTWLELK